jgi:hypothetical protein
MSRSGRCWRALDSPQHPLPTLGRKVGKKASTAGRVL